MWTRVCSNVCYNDFVYFYIFHKLQIQIVAIEFWFFFLYLIRVLFALLLVFRALIQTGVHRCLFLTLFFSLISTIFYGGSSVCMVRSSGFEYSCIHSTTTATTIKFTWHVNTKIGFVVVILVWFGLLNDVTSTQKK